MVKNNICTWIYLEPKGEESIYPQVDGKSSDEKFQAVYWKCVCTFFATSKRQNPSASHVLFSNVTSAQYPVVDGLVVKDYLEGLGVTFHQVPLDTITPKGYHHAWRNQFYVFDILRFISKNGEPGQKHLILDSDCLWTKSSDPIWELMDTYPWPNYIYDYEPDHVVNGISRVGMQQVFSELSGRTVTDVPNYSGGEILAVTTEKAVEIIEGFEIVWPQLLVRHDEGLPKLNEEAHVLSYLHLEKEGLHGEGKLNEHIKRLWTLEKGFNNVEPADESLTIWHLPAEKREGIAMIFRRLRDRRSSFWTLSLPELTTWMGGLVGIPSRKISMNDSLWKLGEKVKGKISNF